MQKKVFLVSVSTALALGWAAGFTSEGLTAAAPRPSAREVTYQFEATPGQQAAIERWVENKFCPQLNADHGLSGPRGCKGGASFTRLTVDWTADDQGVRKLRAQAWATIRGSWVPESAD